MRSQGFSLSIASQATRPARISTPSKVQNPQGLKPPHRVREAGRRPRRQGPGAVGRAALRRLELGVAAGSSASSATSSSARGRHVPAEGARERGRERDDEQVPRRPAPPAGRPSPARARRARKSRKLTETPSRSTPRPPARAGRDERCCRGIIITRAGGGTRPRRRRRKHTQHEYHTPGTPAAARAARRTAAGSPAAPRASSRLDFRSDVSAPQSRKEQRPTKRSPARGTVAALCNTGWAVSQDSAAATSSGSRSPRHRRARSRPPARGSWRGAGSRAGSGGGSVIVPWSAKDEPWRPRHARAGGEPSQSRIRHPHPNFVPSCLTLDA